MTSSILDHRLLRQFIAVAETGSVRAGAQKLNISQPPLTQAIKRLEDGLGVALFERQPKGMALTPAGTALAVEARELLLRIERAEHRVREAAYPGAPLRIGFVSAALNGALTHCLRKLRERGYVRPELQELTTPAQLDALASGQIDLGLLHPPIATQDLTTLSLGRDPFVAAVPSDWDLARRKTLKFQDIADRPLVLFPQSQGPSLMSAIERIAFEVGQTLDVVAHAPRVHSQLAIVASGIGIGLVTESTSRSLQYSSVTWVPISDTRSRLFLELLCVGGPDVIAAVR
ncbi:MAG: LysR family transcriptional regulator [Pseudomonadota bacterium]